MSNPYVGEIRMFAGNFPPAGWAFCDGQLLSIAENEVLFQLIGTTYGGDGQSTFALPDLRARVPIHQGIGPVGTNYIVGQAAGAQQVTLATSQIPAHTHDALAGRDGVRVQSPLGALHAFGEADLFVSGAANALQSGLSSVGGSQPHPNEQPSLCVSFIISLFGIFPSQN